MTDERLSLPSASSMEIVAMCSGMPSFLASLDPSQLIDSTEEDAKLADRGTRIHLARQTGNTLDLSDDEVEDYKRGLKRERELLNQWLADFDLPLGQVEEHLEERLWIHWPDTGKPAASGRLDVHDVCNGRVLVIDWKGRDATPSSESWQGRVQAVAAWHEYDAVSVRFAYMRYGAFTPGAQDFTDYDQADLEQAEKSILYRLWEAAQPNAQRRPGSWCRFCKGRAACPEASAYASVPILASRDPLELVKVMSLEDCAKVFKTKRTVEAIYEAVTERLKSAPEALAELGLGLTMGKKLDKIKDVAGAYAFLRGQGFGDGDLYGAMSFGKEALIEKIRALKGCSKQQAERWLDSQLDQFIERGRAKPSLVEKT